jgi:hypothetical protein
MREQSALHGAVVTPVATPTATPGYFRRVWEHWKQIAHAVGVVQTRFFMVVIYAIVVVPTGLLMRLSRDPLHLRAQQHGNWTPTRPSERSVDAARRQF